MMEHLFNKLVSRLESRLAFSRLRIFKTVYLNFRLLPFRVACRLPVFVYGPTKFYSLAGTVEIQGPIKRGMIKLGRECGFFSAQKKFSMILLDAGAKICFQGPCTFDVGYVLRLTGSAYVEFGKHTRFGSGVKIISEHSIKIGSYTVATYDTCIMDSNMHFTVDITSNLVADKAGEIIIGNYNWIACGCLVRKGTVTKDYTITASKSLLNKDYTRLEGDFLTLAGSPAKVVDTRHRRIFSTQIDAELSQFFRENGDGVQQLTPEQLAVSFIRSE